MKIVTFILTIIISTGLFAQNSDDSILKSLNENFNLTEYDKPNEIIKFNKDTIIVAGYLGNLSNPSLKNIVYKTIDGGKNWKLIEFNGDAWIYDAYHKKDGKIWMGGSDNYIHYSYDFGETWNKKIKPFNPVNRVLSIFMVNAEFGIAGGLSNGLAITYNNWKTSKQIETPLDQNKFKILKNSARSRIDKIAIIDNLVFINQNDHIYYSNLGKINWTEFNIPVSNFSINENKKQIHLYSRNGKVFVLSSNLELDKTYKEEFGWDNEIKNESVYINTNAFFEKGIKSIKITSIKWIFDKQVHMSALYKSNIQIAKYVNKNGVLFFKSKEYRKTDLQIKLTELLSVFDNNEVNFSLNQILNKLSFNELDYNDYLNFINDLKARRKKEQKWGGDFTSQIKLTNSKFENSKISLDSIDQKHISIIYDKIYLPFLINEQANEILIEIKNGDNEILKVSNKYSVVFSLPWTIELNKNKTTSYSPIITEFIRTIIPPDFNNYEMLLGGELIYELKKEQIIDEIEYKKNGY